MRRPVTLALSVAALLGAAAPAHALREPDSDAERLAGAAVDLRVPGARAPAAVQAARSRLLRDLGDQSFLSTDPVTGGVRFLGRADAYLSRRSGGDARAIALRWAREHRAVLGVSAADLQTLRLAHRYRAPNGVTRLIFTQTHRGVPAFDNGLRINVDRHGRVVNVGGSPRPALTVRSVVPRLSAARALRSAARGVGAAALPRVRVLGRARGPRRITRFAGLHDARLTLVSTAPRSARLAWRVWFEESSTAVWDVLVDARSGRVLRRAPKLKWATGNVWPYHPGAPAGGEHTETVFPDAWATEAGRLRGNNAHVYNDAFNHEECHHLPGTEGCAGDDVDPTQADGDLVLPTEEIRPQGIVSGEWLWERSPIPSPTGYCPAAGCTWNHLVNGSWRLNLEQDATNLYFHVNRFHDHLAAGPIAFTEEAGNFQFSNASGKGAGNDGVFSSAMDGAGVVAGRPVPTITSDNANMLTRPDGQAPRMQMYLFEPVEAGSVLAFPFSDVSSGEDASVIYHEYTHGLTNRLVIDAEGRGALDGAQSGAMGEAWSDWYAMDFIMGQGFERDTDTPAEIKTGLFVDGGQDLVRTEAGDCTLGAPIEACPRKRSGLASEGGGGYTYEHFGRVSTGPQVHADGEIWGQTLFDLRRRLTLDHGDAEGTRRAREYVTRALTLSPDNPSYIDMRNAILQAATIAGSKDNSRIWEVFAARGMGASASAVDGSDTGPVAGFDLPPGLPPADMLAPVVAIDSPRSGTVVRAGVPLKVTGTAVDDAVVTAFTVDGAAVAISGTAWQFTRRPVAGPQVITARAADVEGRTGVAEVRVIGDVSRPRLRVRLRRGRVSGSVRDDTGRVRVTVGGRRVKVRRGRFVAVARGKRVAVVARDRAGRTTRRTLTR